MIKEILQQQQLKRNCLVFLAEIEKNLETFYVADQRQFITQPFLTQAWEMVQADPIVRKHEAISVYAGAMTDFNRLLNEQKEYEQWYTGDSKNKTPENGRKLHVLKQSLEQKLRSLEAVIIPAGQALEGEMLQLGLLKYEQ